MLSTEVETHPTPEGSKQVFNWCPSGESCKRLKPLIEADALGSSDKSTSNEFARHSRLSPSVQVGIVSAVDVLASDDATDAKTAASASGETRLAHEAMSLLGGSCGHECLAELRFIERPDDK